MTTPCIKCDKLVLTNLTCAPYEPTTTALPSIDLYFYQIDKSYISIVRYLGTWHLYLHKTNEMVEEFTKNINEWMITCEKCSGFSSENFRNYYFEDGKLFSCGTVVYLGGIPYKGVEDKTPENIIMEVIKSICIDPSKDDLQHKEFKEHIESYQYDDSDDMIRDPTDVEINFAKVRAYCPFEFWPGEVSSDSVNFLKCIMLKK